MENRENTIAMVDGRINFTAQQIETIKKTVAVGASNDELFIFLSIASTNDLNPFLKEIWCIKMNGRTVITTSRDGYLKIANRDKHFRGLVSDVVYSGDKFGKTKDGVEHSYQLENRGNIVGAYALVYRDDRDFPTYIFAPFKDYYRPSKDYYKGTWDQYPHAMILKVAEAMALKRAFSISGLVTQEELEDGNKKEKSVEVQTVQQRQIQSPEERERNIQLNQLYNRYLAVCDNQKQHVFNAMKKITGKENSIDFTEDDIKNLFEDVIRREDEAAFKDVDILEPPQGIEPQNNEDDKSELEN